VRVRGLVESPQPGGRYYRPRPREMPNTLGASRPFAFIGLALSGQEGLMLLSPLGAQFGSKAGSACSSRKRSHCFLVRDLSHGDRSYRSVGDSQRLEFPRASEEAAAQMIRPAPMGSPDLRS